MARTNVLPADAPAWVTKDRQINELIYSCSFLSAHPMKCIHGRFFTVDGLVPDEGSLKQIIFDDISEWKESGVARKVDDLLKTIKLMAYSEDIPLHYDRIHVANGTWYLDGRFTGDKEYCRNRLMVDYNPDADMPGVWLRFLSELLIPEDIMTLQEYMGYCLIPTTKAQKMLMLIGKGGEGNLPNACNASDQTIILSTDTEIDYNYYEMMKDSVGDEFILVYSEETKSTTVKKGYFHEL